MSYRTHIRANGVEFQIFGNNVYCTQLIEYVDSLWREAVDEDGCFFEIPIIDVAKLVEIVEQHAFDTLFVDGCYTSTVYSNSSTALSFTKRMRELMDNSVLFESARMINFLIEEGVVEEVVDWENKRFVYRLKPGAVLSISAY